MESYGLHLSLYSRGTPESFLPNSATLHRRGSVAETDTGVGHVAGSSSLSRGKAAYLWGARGTNSVSALKNFLSELAQGMMQSMNSSTAVEQLLGRVLRMPYAKARQQEALNKAYAHIVAENFAEAAQNLKDRMVQNMG